MRVSVVVFPGSNCDRDCVNALRRNLGWQANLLWHEEEIPAESELVILPGGFSHGDHLRAGALAALSPVMAKVKNFAEKGGYVLGICNGFQILCESGLLPGILRINKDLLFHCHDVRLKVTSKDSAFTNACPDFLTLPIAHKEGNFFAPPDLLHDLEINNQVLFRYVVENNEQTMAGNPNGSLANIAGIRNRAGNVAGLMPHPERVCDSLLGGMDGKFLFESLANARSKSISGIKP